MYGYPISTHYPPRIDSAKRKETFLSTFGRHVSPVTRGILFLLFQVLPQNSVPSASLQCNPTLFTIVSVAHWSRSRYSSLLDELDKGSFGQWPGATLSFSKFGPVTKARFSLMPSVAVLTPGNTEICVCSSEYGRSTRYVQYVIRCDVMKSFGDKKYLFLVALFE